MNDNIVLIGFMGSGKTTFGKWISRKYGYSFCDTDEYIEKKEKTTINDIFASKGEAAFRDMETETVKEFADSLKKCVVSVGGGLPVRKENREILKNIGTVVYLKASEEELCKRLSRDNTRPLLKGGNLKEKIHTLMQQREDIYMDAADVVINTENVSFGYAVHTALFEGFITRLMSYKENIKMKILVMNGPNINFLGIREKGIYGTDNYETLVNMIENKAKELGVEVEVFQSNHEGAVIDKIQEAYYKDVDGIVINPGAFTHYSYAVRDALASVASIPKIEVHISNVHTREEFRHTSVTVPVCNGQVVGLGLKGYLYAMEAVVDMVKCKAKE